MVELFVMRSFRLALSDAVCYINNEIAKPKHVLGYWQQQWTGGAPWRISERGEVAAGWHLLTCRTLNSTSGPAVDRDVKPVYGGLMRIMAVFTS